MIVQCATCEREIYRKQSQVKEKNYCSMLCSSQARSKRVIVKCALCECHFVLSSAVAERNKLGRFYCSIHRSYNQLTQCSACGKFITRPRDVIKERNYCSRECFSKATTSSIETTVEEHLKQWGFKEGEDYFTQKHFQSGRDYPEGNFKMIPDFYLPHLNTVVECNGTYWHADPVQYPDRSKINETQREDLKRYERKVRYYRSRGINLIELWERDNKKAEDIVLAPLILLVVCKSVI